MVLFENRHVFAKTSILSIFLHNLNRQSDHNLVNKNDFVLDLFLFTTVCFSAIK